MINSTVQVDSCTIYLFTVSSKAHKDDSQLKNKKIKVVKEKDTPKPKVGGNKKNYHCRSARSVGPERKEFVTKVAGLENHTFDMENAEYAAWYQRRVGAVTNHIQRDYKGGPKITKVIRDMILPTIVAPNYPTPVARMVINKEVKYIWQQEVKEAMKRIVLLNKNKKQADALVFGQCSPELISKIQDPRCRCVHPDQLGSGCYPTTPHHPQVLLQL